MLKKIDVLFEEKYVVRFILLFTITPFISLSFLNVPLGDDFWYANSLIENGFVGTQIKWYNEWSGRYVATFAISTLNPLAYGYLKLAFIHPLILLIGTILSLKVFLYHLVDVFAININKALLFSVLLFFYINYLPDIGETFYWMAGAYTYQLPIIFFLLYLNSLLHLFYSKKTKKVFIHAIFAIFCLFIVIGCNEVFALYSCMINVFIFFILVFLSKGKVKYFTFILAFTFVLTGFMIFAPGNFARESIFEKPDFHLIKASFNALSRSMFVMFFWLPSLTLVLLFFPNIHKIVLPSFELPNVAFLRNKKSLFVIGLIFLLTILFLGFFPSIYTTRWIPQRAYTPIFFVFTLFCSILIFIAIIKTRKLTSLNQLFSNNRSTPLLMLIIIIALSHNSNVMNAYLDLTSGKAISYHKQVTETYDALSKGNTKDTIYIKELIKKPIILPVRWPVKNNRLANYQWESYFKIKQVELE